MLNYGGITTIYVESRNSAPKEKSFGDVTVGSLEDAVRVCVDLRRSGVLQPITVKISSGFYPLKSPLILTSDIGAVCFESLSGNAEDVVIGGAEKVKGEKDAFNGKRCLSVPKKDGVSDLYVGKTRALPTRFPKNGYLNFAGAENHGIMLDDISKWVRLDPKDVKELSTKEIEGATLNFLHYWVDEHAGVEKFDKRTGKLVMKEHSRFGIYGEKTEAVYYLTNVKKTFGEKGRWYSDEKSGKIYYVPTEKQKDDVDFYLPHLHNLVLIKGKPDDKVKNVTFKNVTFAYTRGDREIFREDGLKVASDGQAAAGAGGAFEMEYAENCKIIGCKFAHYGLYGVNVSDGCANIVITKSQFVDGGAGGVKVSGSDFFGKEEARTRAVEISDCEISDCGKRYMAACGILIGHACDNKIIHNEIHDLYYSGVSIGWVWGYKESVTKNNYVAFNKIYNLGKGVLSDMGGIYLLGAQPGTVVDNNLIYGVKAREYGGWAIYTDEGSAYIVVENNVCYDCSENCFHQHYGKMNVIRNNAFARAGAELCRITRGEMHLSAVFENNVYFADGCAIYGLLGKEHIENGGAQTRNNIICYSGSKKDLTVIVGYDKKYDFSEAQKLGLETGSILSDGEFKTTSDGAAETVFKEPSFAEFKPIDLKKVGIRR